MDANVPYNRSSVICDGQHFASEQAESNLPFCGEPTPGRCLAMSGPLWFCAELKSQSQRFDQGSTARGRTEPGPSERSCLPWSFPPHDNAEERERSADNLLAQRHSESISQPSVSPISDSCIPDGVGCSPPRHTRCSQSEKISLAFCESKIFTTPQFSLLDY